MENHGGTISTGKLLIFLPELSGNPTRRVIYYQIRRNMAKEMMNLAFKVSLFTLRSKFFLAV
jgi:hypothetical protein